MRITFFTILLCLIFSLSADARNCTCVKNGDRWELPDGSPCPNIIQTAIPFLRIAPDARSTGMGDLGIATSADAAAMHFNAAKLAFMESDKGFSVTYTPWLRALNLNDVFLAQVAGYSKIGKDQAIGVELKWFSLGTIQYTDRSGNPAGRGNPNEFSLAVAYARKLSKNLSASLTGKFIRSNLAQGQVVNGVEITAGVAGAADISVFYDKDIKGIGNGGHFRLGAALSNLGNKVSYSNSVEKEFIPINLGIGTNYEIDINEYNSFSIGLDLNKLLVPTPPLDPAVIATYETPGLIDGIFSSFGDSPNGANGELREILISIGMEYWYNKQFAVRAGFFHEDVTKGNRDYITLGLGLKYNVFGIDFSYLVPTDGAQSALNNTLRFSLIFDLGARDTEI